MVSQSLPPTGFSISYYMSTSASRAAQSEQVCRVAQLAVGTPAHIVCVSGVLFWIRSDLLLSTQQPSAMQVLRAHSW